jgi:hypothetical protein
VLQELWLVDGVFTIASFQQLPQSLTQLSLEWSSSNTISQTLTASTAPGLCQLTGLQGIRLSSGAIGLDLLASLTSLTKLDIGRVDLQRPGTLSALTALTQLTYMLLPRLDATVIPTDDDIAAVAAPPQLQVLNLSDTHVSATMCKHIFPASRQLTQLLKLFVSVDLIHDGREAALVAACCPNVETIILTESLIQDWVAEEDWVAGEDHIVAAGLTSMLKCWQSLQHLTYLVVSLQDLPMLPGVWRASARLTQLQHVNVNINDMRSLSGVVHMTSCTRLKSLCVNARFLDSTMDNLQVHVRSEEVSVGGWQ